METLHVKVKTVCKKRGIKKNFRWGFIGSQALTQNSQSFEYPLYSIFIGKCSHKVLASKPGEHTSLEKSSWMAGAWVDSM